MTALTWLDDHRRELQGGLDALRGDAGTVSRWARLLADRLVAGGRLLTVGNGGSAAEAQHLTSELVGRFLTERRPFSAICLSAETSSLTAIVNDYGPDEMFARQVEGHGRRDDVLMLLSTSGSSANVLRAAERGHELGLHVWAMTGPAPNPLQAASHDSLCVQAPSTAAVQEVHLVAIHALCAAVDAELASLDGLVRRTTTKVAVPEAALPQTTKAATNGRWSA
ncbi:SIS domain-containing protein [Georgenia halophila]|uniref:SIS domain-containing protein n=1 Tax=Georgenia halophila TaxID=620889 RepID=A0ABP8LCN6_9MICO